MLCPSCQTYNEEGNKFCMKCGATLPATESTEPIHSPIYHLPPPQVSGGSWLNIWGPFAGYGNRRRHIGWLMNGQGGRVPELIKRVEARFREREIQHAFFYPQILTGRGVFVEQRNYFILQRGLASLALYISKFGRDLFISQASYLKPPVSNFRVLAVVGMILFQGYAAYNSYGVSQKIPRLSYLPDSEMYWAFFSACILGPLALLCFLAFMGLLFFSAYKWLTEKDFFAALRVPPNEFNEDDLMAMEKAVEETVRQSLTDLKLNPDDLKMTSTERGRQLF